MPEHRLFPVFLDLDRRVAVVIGSGGAAEKRARQLLRYGADVTVICKDPSPSLLAAEADGLITVEQRDYVSGDLAGAFVAMCESDDVEVGRAVASEAESRGCLVKVASSPDASSFSLPSTVHRGPLQIAVSTAGLAPDIASRVRREIKERYDDAWGAHVELVGEVRARALDEGLAPEQVELVVEAASAPEVLERLRAGETVTADSLLAEIVASLPADAADSGAEGEGA